MGGSNFAERGYERGTSNGGHRWYGCRRTRAWIGWASAFKSFSARALDFIDCALWGKEDDSKLEQRLKPISDLGEKVRLVRKRNVGK